MHACSVPPFEQIALVGCFYFAARSVIRQNAELAGQPWREGGAKVGVSIHYWAMPPSSSLFERLRTNQAFVTLMSTVFAYGNGVFCFFDELDPEEREEILGDLISTRQLGDEQQARRVIDEFRREVERTRRAYPGIERRRTSLEKTFLVVEERTKEALRQVRDDADKFVDSIMNGSQSFTGSIDPNMWIGLVPADLVQKGARMLAGVNAEALLANDAAHVLRDFESWQDLYRDAGAHGDAILVGACP
jgi:hypothetical protein